MLLAAFAMQLQFSRQPIALPCIKKSIPILIISQQITFLKGIGSLSFTINHLVTSESYEKQSCVHELHHEDI